MRRDNPLIFVPIRYSIYGSIINIGALLILYYFGRHPLLLNPFFDARLPLYLVFIYFSMKTYRDQFNAGSMHFWQGIAIGLLNYMSMALIVSVFIQIFAGIESTHFLSNYIQLASEQMLANKDAFVEALGLETFEETMLELPRTTSLHLAADFLLKSMPIGLFLTIILAVLMRRK